MSAAAAYLHPVANRQNLQIETGALVTRVIIEDGRATGVEFTRDGLLMRVEARAEVILCGGSVASPVLLERSGIGAGQHLQDLGIAVVADRREVGENLQDHYLMSASARLKAGTPSMNGTAAGWPLLKSIAEYVLSRKGLLSSASCSVTGFIRSRPEVEIPDLQLLAAAATIDRNASAAKNAIMLDEFPGLTIGGWVLRPESRGSCHASSAAPSAAPAIQFNYLSTQADVIDAVNLLRAFRNMFRQPSLAALVEYENPPFRDASDDFDTLAELSREIGCSGDHPIGTCRMGGHEQSVVDPQLRVRGVSGLRVADASVMPQLISGNTNAACMMIGEMASNFILKPV